MDNARFATELLAEVKLSSRRWFVAFCIMVVLEIATIAGFMWYITLPVEENVTTTQTLDGENNTDVMQIGGDYNESDTDENN